MEAAFIGYILDNMGWDFAILYEMSFHVVCTIIVGKYCSLVWKMVYNWYFNFSFRSSFKILSGAFSRYYIKVTQNFKTNVQFVVDLKCCWKKQSNIKKTPTKKLETKTLYHNSFSEFKLGVIFLVCSF